MWRLIVTLLLFYIIPLALAASLLLSLHRYFSAKSKNKKNPGTYSPEEMGKRKLIMCVCVTITAILAAIALGFMGLLFLAVAFM